MTATPRATTQGPAQVEPSNEYSVPRILILILLGPRAIQITKPKITITIPAVITPAIVSPELLNWLELALISSPPEDRPGWIATVSAAAAMPSRRGQGCQPEFGRLLAR